jgi:diphthine synthase
MDDCKLYSGKAGSLSKINFANGPHSIIIPGSLHFTEEEALQFTTKCLDRPVDNSKKIEKISARMIHNYVPKARKAANELRIMINNALGKESSDNTIKNNDSNDGIYNVIDNAEYYLDDAIRFLNEGKNDLAVLSVGYAEGLIDAIRYQKGVNPW